MTKRRLAQPRWRPTLDAIKSHTAVQGEMIYAANLLHDSFFQIFRTALSLERTGDFGAEIRFHSHILAIWHTIQSDAAQREMAFVAISTVPTELNLKLAIKQLKWAKNCARLLADYRNVVAHSPIMFRGAMKANRAVMIPEFAGHGMRETFAKRLKAITGIGFWRTVRNDLLNLSAFVLSLDVQIQRLDVERQGAELMTAPKTWPRRPRLRSLPVLRKIERGLNPQQSAKKKSKRRGQRPPSRS